MTQQAAGGSFAPPPPPSGPPQPRPPAGPGVVAPFPAPPRERNPRLWIGLGAAALVVVLIVVAAVVGLLAAAVSMQKDVVGTADTFLGRVQNQQYGQAYRMQCSVLRQRQSPEQFRRQFSGDHRLVDHRVAQQAEAGDQGAFRVPAKLTFSDGRRASVDVVVVPASGDSGGYTVCGFGR